ncbi:hypothetical protein CHLNCDRAFT_136132 [Chlorella variabilis]|uniref:Sigma 54 modulation/S30EA ribosomal protein C-terminal domain-containing protein n=1 Tax=Chlorella variabilis TaxID=554065 RepID=E1ZJU2_CHLVA|nr:hypothetical protein CHLNCDRAFT_136132 [Chlorella variabilis]EFN54053.1 hypothetical protein CHLNCDRAFT_136132 [Chlorella variabilis]|eukprot:XP_005846155.1 hypothetical protein CHLNCDRAFT_136132 [Chlorella variabilis]
MLAAIRPRPAVAATQLTSKSHVSAKPGCRQPHQRLVARRAAVLAVAEVSSTARIVVQGRNLETTPAIKQYCEDKVGKAVKNFDGIKEVDVKLSVRGNPRGRGTEAHHQREQIVEVTVFTLRHGVVRVEEHEDDLYAAVDLVSDKLKRKLVKVKERAVQKANWPGRGGPKGGDTIAAHLGEDVVDKLPTDQIAPPLPEVVREKVLEVTAMSTDEAMDQIENVGHDFYLFKDSADGAMKVLYRRKSHGFGVIIPKA